MTVPTSVRQAIDWVLREQGFVPDGNSVLAQMARDVWDDWWSTWTPPSGSEALGRITAALDRPRPARWGFSSSTTHNTLAWVRMADHVVTTDQNFPYHHTAEETANYLTTWTKARAYREMTGASWRLVERPNGWAGEIVTNGNHRSLLALASGVPLIRVHLAEVTLGEGQPFELHDPTARGPRRLRATQRLRNTVSLTSSWSPTTVATLQELARQKLCAEPDIEEIEANRRSRDQFLELPWVTAEFPWIVAETLESVAHRRALLAQWADLDPL